MCAECGRGLQQVAHLVGLRRQPHPCLARSIPMVPAPSVRGQPYEELDLRPAAPRIHLRVRDLLLPRWQSLSGASDEQNQSQLEIHIETVRSTDHSD